MKKLELMKLSLEVKNELKDINDSSIQFDVMKQ